MTGFGVADGTVAGGRLHIEIRTVNHRHFNVQMRLPSALQEVELPSREHLRSRISRGHVSVAGRWLEEPPRDALVQVNTDRARHIITALNELKDSLDLEGKVDLAFVARLPEVVTIAPAPEAAATWEEMRPVLDAALDRVEATREREGATLATEVAQRLAAIGARLETVIARAPLRVDVERQRLRKAVADLLDGRPVDEDRLAHEIAIMADRLDITEEVVRLRTHLSAASDGIAGTSPVGKQLGFLAQEMLREINTIGSKANDAPIAHAVIGMKGELEKFREQIENLE
jgi:uncharacterized protein (TIGR00255 family)